MAKVNVYLPDELERAVRDADLSVSAICQTALRDAVARVTALRERGRGTFTSRLASIIADLESEAALEGRQVTSLHLLAGILLHGENLGARALTLMGVDLPPPKAGRPVRGEGELAADARETLASAYRVAVEMRQDQIGTEHVVIALAQAESPLGGAFETLGIEPRSLRHQVERLIANPWTTEGTEPADLITLERLDAMVQDLAAQLGRLKEER